MSEPHKQTAPYNSKKQTAAAPPPRPAPSNGYINTTETARISPQGGKKKAADA